MDRTPQGAIHITSPESQLSKVFVAGVVYLAIGRPSKSPLYAKGYQGELEEEAGHTAETRRASRGRQARRPSHPQAGPSSPTHAE